jgi:hypothetical protein
LAVGTPYIDGIPGEPTKLDKDTLRRVIDSNAKTLGVSPGQSTWSAEIKNGLGTYFESTEETGGRVSLNEILVSLIACSKGTVGDKALGFFHIYGSVMASPPRMHHIHPVSHYSKAVVEKVEVLQERSASQMYQAPAKDDDEMRAQTALHFKVWERTSTSASGYGSGTTMGENGVLLASVYIPTLKPFIFSGMAGGLDNASKFSMWAPPTQLPPGTIQDSSAMSAGKSRPCVGQMSMSIKWMPSEENPHIGQLGVHLFDIFFDGARI